MFTRSQYLDGVCTHNEYYAQFVNEPILDCVKGRIGVENIKKSTNKHFNDIPLRKWDDIIGITTTQQKLMKELGESYTIAVGVCILKAAARIIKESE